MAAECTDEVCALPQHLTRKPEDESEHRDRDESKSESESLPPRVVEDSELPAWMSELHVSPDDIVTDRREVAPLSTYRDTPLVGLYFSASWCGPCRAFTPMLAEFQRDHRGEIVIFLMGMDRTEPQFERYLAGTGFLSTPFRAPLVDRMASKFGVYSLPTLVVVDAKGKLLTDWGRSAVLRNGRNCVRDWQQGKSGISWLQLFGLSF